jgi:hypothetical protein
MNDDISKTIVRIEVERLQSSGKTFSREYLDANITLATQEIEKGQGEAARRPVAAIISELSLLPANHELHSTYSPRIDALLTRYTAALCTPIPVYSPRSVRLDGARDNYLAPHLAWMPSTQFD